MWFFDRRLFAHFDYLLLLVVILVPVYGLLVLYSAGYDPDTQGYTFGLLSESIKSPAFAKQLAFLLTGLGFIFIAILVPTQFWERHAYTIYIIFTIFLIAVFIVGKGSHGAVRWLSIAGFTFQPSELMKVGVILALARYLSRRTVPPSGYGLKELIVPGLIILYPMILIVEQPDLGTSLVIGAIGALMLLFMGIRLKVIIGLIVTVVLAVIPLWNFYLMPYQQARVLILIDPGSDPKGSGYHVEQSKIAVGSGMFSGKGFLKGTQTQLQFLPEHTTDFIFSVLGEEFGFVGSVALVFLYVWLLYLIIVNASRCRDLFGSLVCIGVAAQIFFQAFVNMGMVIGIMPVVGITLPLFSYGGSSLMSIMFSLGLVLGIAMRRFMFVPNS